jgi:hypothetical protein
LLTLFGLPTARFIGYLHSVRGRDGQGRALTSAAELTRLLHAEAGRRICFKSVEGSGGLGFVAFDVLCGPEGLQLRHPVSGEVESPQLWYERLAQSADGWLIEEYLHQHPALAALNASSVNTLRLFVLEQHGQFRTVGGFLRVGRAGSQVDNTARGGLACPIDLLTGRVCEALDLTPARNQHPVHPDSKVPLIGLQIPFWDQCLDLAGAALSCFPHMRFAGLDIAVTERGPCVIELNVDPARQGAAHLDLPHRDMFEPALKLQRRARGQP